MLLFWVLFNLFVLAMLALDLGVFHRKTHTVRFQEALAWSAVWVTLACAFAVLVYFWHGRAAALEFGAGYLIELSLSVDNLFVFVVLFTFFRVPAELQHRVLFWGIVGALVMRLAFILAGVALINRFHWIIYIFGAFLIFTGIKLATHDDSDVHPDQNPVLKLLRRWLPMTSSYHGSRFFITERGRRIATPLVAVLVAVETTDLMFAVDSIPAVLAITRDPFIVYTSNVFAILGLRSMYFALAGMFDLFQYLNYGLSAILVFVGAKMLLANDGLTLWGFPLHCKVSIEMSLAVIGSLLAISIVASLLFPSNKRKGPAPGSGVADPGSGAG
jgi:tellurite resistance protein TerC